MTGQRVCVLGAGWYGCAIAEHLMTHGYDVTVFESAPALFAGASGNNPARLHQGWHYPRSRDTRSACQRHNAAFLQRYGHLTRAVPVNIYAIARKVSMLDFGTYLQAAGSELPHLVLDNPEEFGLRDVEGAVMTTERHVVIPRAKQHFSDRLAGRLQCNSAAPDTSKFDAVVDCTFCALAAEDVDRYEPCLVLVFRKKLGVADKSVTIMDGQLPGFYAWSDQHVSLSSAKYTPFTKACRTYAEALDVLRGLSDSRIASQSRDMVLQMCHYYPTFMDEYAYQHYLTAVRALPASAADARLVDVVQTDKRSWRVRAGKIDAVIQAADTVLANLQQADG